MEKLFRKWIKKLLAPIVREVINEGNSFTEHLNDNRKAVTDIIERRPNVTIISLDKPQLEITSDLAAHPVI